MKRFQQTPLDPRYTQIIILFTLVIAGGFSGRVDVSLFQLLISLSCCLLCQYIASALTTVSFEWRSALITGLSLSLLLRMNSLSFAVLAAVIAISSKFLIRSQNKHIFNPANFSIVVLLLLDAPIWVSPGQWGSDVVLIALLYIFGLAVLLQTRQWDIAFSFLAVFSTLLFLRGWYLGDPASIAIHQLQNGALMIFAFFMLSDPKTIPTTKRYRFVFATMVAVFAYVLLFQFQLREAIFYALFMSCLMYSLNGLWLQQWKGRINAKTC